MFLRKKKFPLISLNYAIFLTKTINKALEKKHDEQIFDQKDSKKSLLIFQSKALKVTEQHVKNVIFKNNN